MCNVPLEDLKIGEKVWVSLRQERIKLGQELNKVDNVMNAKIIDQVFIGSIIKYYMKVDNSLELIALLPNNDSSFVFKKGETVQIGWDPTDMVFLKES